jgi:hypothetical protein
VKPAAGAGGVSETSSKVSENSTGEQTPYLRLFCRPLPELLFAGFDPAGRM